MGILPPQISIGFSSPGHDITVFILQHGYFSVYYTKCRFYRCAVGVSHINFGHYGAVLHQQQAVTVAQGKVGVMQSDKPRLLPLMQYLSYFSQHHMPVDKIQCTVRLVHQHHRRILRKGARQYHQLLLPLA